MTEPVKFLIFEVIFTFSSLVNENGVGLLGRLSKNNSQKKGKIDQK